MRIGYGRVSTQPEISDPKPRMTHCGAGDMLDRVAEVLKSIVAVSMDNVDTAAHAQIPLVGERTPAALAVITTPTGDVGMQATRAAETRLRRTGCWSNDPRG